MKNNTLTGNLNYHLLKYMLLFIPIEQTVLTFSNLRDYIVANYT